MDQPDYVYLLRVCDKSLRGYNGFQWPASGPVEWPDGRSRLFAHPPGWHPVAGWCNAPWNVCQVIRVAAEELVGRKDLVDEKDSEVQFRRGEVIYTGDAAGALRVYYERNGTKPPTAAERAEAAERARSRTQSPEAEQPEYILVLVPVDEALRGYTWLCDYPHQQFPRSGPVECPEWDPDPKSSKGLHALLPGVAPQYFRVLPRKWLVVRVLADDIVDRGRDVKFPRGEVVYCGDQGPAGRMVNLQEIDLARVDPNNFTDVRMPHHARRRGGFFARRLRQGQGGVSGTAF